MKKSNKSANTKIEAVFLTLFHTPYNVAYEQFSFACFFVRDAKENREKKKNGRMKSWRRETRKGETIDKARDFDISRAGDFSMEISKLNRNQQNSEYEGLLVITEPLEMCFKKWPYTSSSEVKTRVLLSCNVKTLPSGYGKRN